jgi:glutamate racemase
MATSKPRIKSGFRTDAMTKSAPVHIGILDWGIGGIGLYQMIKRAHPSLAITYWSDAGFTPYGKLSAPALAARIRAVAISLRERGVTHLAIACNAASTVLPLGNDPKLPTISGVIEHGVRAANQWGRTAGKRSIVAIVGGRRTILSGNYRREIQRSSHLTVKQRIAQPLSALIESGQLHSAIMTQTLTKIMRPIRDADALILACTHYPAIASQFALHAPNAKLIDPAQHMLRWIESHWPMTAARRGSDTFLTTGDPQAMQRAALAAFSEKLPRPNHVKILALRNSPTKITQYE